MERLTERDEYGNANIIGVGKSRLEVSLYLEQINFVTLEQINLVTTALNKLAHYEDMEERGQMLKVPQPLTDVARFDIVRQYQEGVIVEVVKCKDCLYRKSICNNYYCSKGNKLNNENDYCSYGIPKGELE